MEMVQHRSPGLTSSNNVVDRFYFSIDSRYFSRIIYPSYDHDQELAMGAFMAGLFNHGDDRVKLDSHIDLHTRYFLDLPGFTSRNAIDTDPVWFGMGYRCSTFWNRNGQAGHEPGISHYRGPGGKHGCTYSIFDFSFR